MVKNSKCYSLSHIQLFATPWAVSCQASLSMEFSRQEYWSGLPLPSPENLPYPGKVGIKAVSPTSPSLAGGRLSNSDTCCFWATAFQKGVLSLFELPSCRSQGKWKCQGSKNSGLQRWKWFSFLIYYFTEASLHIKWIRNEFPCSFSSYIFWVYLYRSLICPNKWMLLCV